MLSIKAKYENGKIIFKNKINISKSYDVIVTFLETDIDENFELTSAGKKLLKRKDELDNGRVKAISLEEAFDV